MVYIIIIVMFIILFLYVLLPYNVYIEQYEDTIVCPSASEIFQNKKFLKKGKCYDHEATSCQSVLQHMGVQLNVDGMTEEQVSTAINLMSANMYSDTSKNDYNANECVISQKDAKDLGIKDCRLGMLQLKNGNDHDQDVNWAYPDGCVINETQLRGNINELLKSVYKKFRETPEEIQSLLNTRIAANRAATQAHWDRYNRNVGDTGQQRKQEKDAKQRDKENKENTQDQINKERASKANEPVMKGIADHNDHINQGMRRDCKWSWSEWSACQGSCGTGSQNRTVIIHHDNQNGGWPCPQNRNESRSCDTGIDRKSVV